MVRVRGTHSVLCASLLFQDCRGLRQQVIHPDAARRYRRLVRASSVARSMDTISLVPRAAVSVCVKCSLENDHYYLVVQRGQSPNKGMWSLPGGKLEFGEATLSGAKRELSEETSGLDNLLEWYNGTVTTTDAIGESYHYLIAHCYAEVLSNGELPSVHAHDDAADVQWLRKGSIEELELSGSATKGVLSVIERTESMSSVGLLNLK